MGLRILFCDDQPDVVQSLAMLFDPPRYQTAITSSGLECVARAREWKPHLAFLDIGLPDISGYEVASEIRRLPFGTDVVLVAFTGYGDAADIVRATEAGFDQHVKKGGDPLALVEIAARLNPRRI